MQVKSLGWKTELMLARWNGTLTDRGSYVVIQTPNNPGYYWGNFVLQEAAPQLGDLERWQKQFKAAFPSSSHMLFGWDAPELGQIEEFIAAGFVLDHSSVLQLAELKTPLPTPLELEIRPLKNDQEWQQLFELELLLRDPAHELEAYTRYMLAKLKNYRSLTELSLGAWFGAFAPAPLEPARKGLALFAPKNPTPPETQLLGGLGIFFSSDLARYQAVGVHPDYRKQGIASHLVWKAAQYASSKAAEKIIIHAEPSGPAIGLYQRLGFEVVEQQYALLKSK
jgi:ribosomal protein S18 acetylase RimI-like enzyme